MFAGDRTHATALQILIIFTLASDETDAKIYKVSSRTYFEDCN